ncbi:YlmC/YmxH family sporulation protein [Alkaliphilus hydrothermalis]|uniref:YlmC/YmxH family sporulation protein n=1 Tax=Alkaliphilus hydrothermalis TaxID=1482730 RepID=A0ABS2NNU4_9FIRM|nr:YlmC/YmxH family sporulation protein [Alkaliphilus hydrothermalis]MBM7614577.1 YlmC/YmxH family sporulation protein [Alkaliphilus hydrothermalis]
MLRASDLTQKEVINTTDGKRIGMIMDLEVDLAKGRVNAIIIPGTGKFLGLFGKEVEYEISWDQIKKIGEDVILVEMKNTVEPQAYNQSHNQSINQRFRGEEPKKVVLEPEFIRKEITKDDK